MSKTIINEINEITVNELISNKYSTIFEDETLENALSKFNSLTDVLVVYNKNEEYSGIVTERMILRSNLSRKTKINKIKVKAPLIPLDTKLKKAVSLMFQSNINCLPVVKNNTIIGFVFDTDILKLISKLSLSETPVKDVMSTNLIYVSPDEKISNVLRLFRENQISRLPVIEKGEVIGIITLHDIIFKVIKAKERPRFGCIIDEKNSVLNLPVKNFMSFPVITCNINTKIKEVINLMLNNRINSVIILDENKAVGIVTKKDILELIIKEGNAEEINIQISSKFDVNKEQIEKIIKRFVLKFKERLKSSMFYIYLMKHKEKFRRRNLIYCRIKLISSEKKFVVTSQGWGIENAVRLCLVKLEGQLLKTIKSSEDQKNLLKYVEIESL